jgi:hypothetical protein
VAAGDNICLPCHHSCNTCNNNNLPDQCTSCPSGTSKRVDNIVQVPLPDISLGTCTCQPGYYDDTLNQDCKKILILIQTKFFNSKFIFQR